jgi:hypothetical protein
MSSPLFAIAVSILSAQVLAVPSLRLAEQLVAAVNQGSTKGALSALESAPPWQTRPELDALSRDSIVHEFHGDLYALGRADKVLEVRALPSLKLLATFDLRKIGAPRDVVVLHPGLGLVSDNDSAHLWWVDLVTGDVWPGPDLSAYSDADGLPEIERMHLAGQHVYVQMQRFDRNNYYTEYGAKLAVLGPAFNPQEPLVLEDVIDLQGVRPNYRMQVNAAGDRLWVSAPGVDNDWGEWNRGLEEIDLNQRVSLGFVIAEEDFTADLSAFVMVDDDRGYAIVHTSIVASTHLRVFERGGSYINEIHMAFGRLETIAFDPAQRQIFFPEPENGAFAGGVRIFDADGEYDLSGPIDLAGEPFDLIVAQ